MYPYTLVYIHVYIGSMSFDRVCADQLARQGPAEGQNSVSHSLQRVGLSQCIISMDTDYRDEHFETVLAHQGQQLSSSR